MANNRELSQFASFVSVNDANKNVGIATTALPNIGIGTANPSTKFEVVGNTRLQTLIVTGVSTFTGVTTTVSDLYVGGDLYVADDLVFDEFTARNGNITGIATVRILNVGTGGTIITTTTSGLVGIGTTNPLNALAIQKNPTVNGAAIVSISPVSLDSGYSSLLGFIASQNGSMNIGIAGTLPYGNGNITGLDEYSGYIDCYGAPFSIATNSIVRLKINDNGNIGIGTTNPTEKLTVIGVTSSTSFYGDASYTASGRWTLGANGSADYTFTGIGFTQTTNDPVLYLTRGRVYEFVNNSGGSHPFQIRVSDGGSAYSDGVTNNGGASGVIRFEIPFNAPNTLYYQCTSHSGMGNTISVYPNTI